jgi:hypothetical protein
VIEGEVGLTDTADGKTEMVKTGESLAVDLSGFSSKTAFDTASENKNWNTPSLLGGADDDSKTSPNEANHSFGLSAVLLILGFLFGFVYRAVLKKFAKNSPHGISKNIGKPDRLLRFAIGVVLFLFAVAASWNPFLIFFSGFCFFEAIFSWCGLYAAMGKNTCPIE